MEWESWGVPGHYANISGFLSSSLPLKNCSNSKFSTCILMNSIDLSTCLPSPWNMTSFPVRMLFTHSAFPHWGLAVLPGEPINYRCLLQPLRRSTAVQKVLFLFGLVVSVDAVTKRNWQKEWLGFSQVMVGKFERLQQANLCYGPKGTNGDDRK